MRADSPDSGQVHRFAQEVARLAGGIDMIGIAVSGGPDSLALLLLAHAAFPGKVSAATVDHGLRPESRGEADFVARLCGELGMEHRILPVAVDPVPASVQRSARQARYRALDAWLDSIGATTLATAHHADDQAETLLMRLIRGAGVSGLAGVRAAAPCPVPGSSNRLIRPLLGWRRAELEGIVAAAGIAAVDDPSNRDPRFDRTRIRTRLAESDWIEATAIARSAGALADADEALRWMAQRVYRARVSEQGGQLTFTHEGLPREMKRRTLWSVLEALDPQAAPRGAEIDRLLDTLEAEGTGTLCGIKAVGKGAEWCFGRAPPRRTGG